MQRKSIEDVECPFARSLELVGEWWTPFILRDLGIAPAVLTGPAA